MAVHGLLHSFFLHSIVLLLLLLLLCPLISSTPPQSSPPFPSLKLKLIHREHYLSPIRRPRHLNFSRETIYNDRRNYLVNLNVGSSAGSQWLMLDLSSSMIWIQCNPCNPRLKTKNELFDPSQSSSYRKLPASSCTKPLRLASDGRCTFALQHPEGNCSGDVATERFLLSDGVGRKLNQDLVFGCAHRVKGAWRGRMSGSLGLGPGPTSFPMQLFRLYGASVFSYCLIPWPNCVGSCHSYLRVGSDAIVDSRDANIPLLHPLNGYRPHYSVTLHGISVGIAKLDFPSSSLAIVTHRSFGTLAAPTFDKVKEVLVAQLARKGVLPAPARWGLDLCFHPMIAEFWKLPAMTKMTLHLEGTQLVLGSMNVLVGDDMGFCLAFVRDAGGSSSLGTIQQHDIKLSFDLGRSLLRFDHGNCMGDW